MTAGIVATSCISDPVKTLCDFDLSGDVVATTLIDGSEIGGNVNTIARQAGVTFLPAAVAKTSRDYVTVPYNTTCQGPYGYYPCTLPYNIDLRRIYGVGYAEELYEAKDLARRNCREAARRFRDNANLIVWDGSMDCRVIHSTNCPVR